MVVRRVSNTSSQAVGRSRELKKTVVGNLTRPFLLAAGTFFVALGIAGILLPLLPTTPFLLLAAACYARSSRRFHNWLMTNRFFGDYIRNYLDRRGIPPKVKILSISLLWITIGCSAAFAVDVLWARILLVVIAIGVTAHILSLPTLTRKGKTNQR